MEEFLASQDHCRFATVDEEGYPHCVPVGYHYHGGKIYIPTNALSKKVSNLRKNPRSCVIVDVPREEDAPGVMLQGTARPTKADEFHRLKEEVESRTGWDLGRWRVGDLPRERVTTILVFEPQKVSDWV